MGSAIRFAKMHGQGNDFVVIDAVRQSISLTPEKVRRIADRHLGVGCDQLLVVEPPSSAQNDFRYRIYNADGGEVEQCGNGARCFARFVRAEGLTTKDEIRVETAAGVIVPRIEDDGRVTVDMGAPRFEPAALPFAPEGDGPPYGLRVDGSELHFDVVSMGNPHAVQVVADIESAPVHRHGPLLENHPAFPRRVNAGFMQVLERGEIALRVWERGAGETLACGTGACAAVAIGVRRGILDGDVEVITRGGRLRIRWPGEGHAVMMTGDAVRVFDGTLPT